MNRWFRRVNVRNKVLLGYGTSLLLMAVLGVLVFRGLQYSLATSRSVQHSQIVLRNANAILLGLVNMETGERGFVITGDETFLQPYNDSVKSVASSITDTEALVSDNPAQTQRMLQIAAAAQDWQHGIVEPEIQARRSSADSAAALVKTGQGKAALDKVRALCADFTSAEQDLLTSRAHSSDDANQQLQAVIVGGTTLAALLGLVGALTVAQSLARRVNVVASAAQAVAAGDLAQTVPALESGDEIDTLGQAFNVMTQSLREGESTKVDKQTLESVLGESQTASSNLASTASEILASVTEQDASATQQAAAVTEATATVDEVLRTAEQASERAEAVADKARQAADVASKGLDTVESTTQGMKTLRGQVESIAEQVLALSEQTQQIGEIITTVEDLADQSNLLAVNAAIEASRAGEQGRGFAVVAQEVRNMAERSKAATVQVRTILTDIQRATNAAVLATEQGTKGAQEGARLVEMAGQAIVQLDETIRDSAGAAQQIVASVGQVTQGMDQIALAMTSINQGTTSNATGTRQLQKAAENINDLSHSLVALVSRYNPNGRSGHNGA